MQVHSGSSGPELAFHRRILVSMTGFERNLAFLLWTVRAFEHASTGELTGTILHSAHLNGDWIVA